MKNSHVLVGGALIILVIGILMYKKGQKGTAPASAAAAGAAPASPTTTAAAAAPVPAPAVSPQPGFGIIAGEPSGGIVQTQVFESGSALEMQTFIK